MSAFNLSGACDCHSHVFGPFANFPLSEQRTFDPPESPIQKLETTWQALGIERAVLVQGSAHGDDHSAMLAALEESPAKRRGVALLKPDVSNATLTQLHRAGIRAVRLNWIRHLLGKDTDTVEQRLTNAARLLARVATLGWHVEVHIDIDDIELVTRLERPDGMRLVIDHMARLDLSLREFGKQLQTLLRVVDENQFWVKTGGADRLTSKCERLEDALSATRDILSAAPSRTVWGLDWPHVNLVRKRSDAELVSFIQQATGNENSLRRLLVSNPEQLYDFESEKELRYSQESWNDGAAR